MKVSKKYLGCSQSFNFEKTKYTSQGKKVRGSQWTLTPTLTGVVLGAALKDRKIPYDIITGVSLDSPLGIKIVRDKISHNTYKIIGLSTTFLSTNNFVRNLCNQIKSLCPDCKIVVGGPFLVGNERILDISAIDYYVFGDGEEAFPSLVESIAQGILNPQIGGVLYREKGNLAGNRNYSPVNISEQRLPAWEDYLLSIDRQKREHLCREAMFPFLVEITRGCPFRCAFCNYCSIYKKVRYKSAEVIMGEIKELCRLGVRNIGFWDSTLSSPKPRLERLVEMLEKSNFADIQFSGFARIDDLDSDIIRRMAKVGFRGIYLGIESGNDKILEKMKKNITRQQILDFFSKFNGTTIPIDFLGSFIVGFPGETLETIEDTIDLMERTKIKYFNIQPQCITQGSDLYNHPERYGLRYEISTNTRGAFKWKHETMNSDEATEEALKMFARIHFQTNSLMIEPLFCVTELSHKFSPVISKRNFRFLRLIQEGIALSLMNREDCNIKQEEIWLRLMNESDILSTNSVFPIKK